MKPRVLIVGTAYAIPEHRKKLAHLAARFDLTCATARECCGFGWSETTDTAPPDAYRLIGLQSVGASATGTRCWYRGLGAIFRNGRYDLILVENEPWGLLRWQSWLLKSLFQRHAVFGEFTWENIRRAGWRGCLLAIAYRLAARTADFVVGGNRDAVELMLQSGAAPPAVACVPQFGVDITCFLPLSDERRNAARREAGLASDTFVIAFCGRLAPEKGIRDLATAFDRLEPRSNAIVLLIVGAGELECEVRELTSRDPRIHLWPPRKHSQMARVLQLADVLVLPSRTTAGPRVWWREQFGHILIEAMACGTVAIGSDCGAIPEVLGDPSLIFPEGGVKELTALLQALIADSPRLHAIRARQREQVLTHFTQAAVAEQWARVFAHQLASRNSDAAASTAG